MRNIGGGIGRQCSAVLNTVQSFAFFRAAVLRARSATIRRLQLLYSANYHGKMLKTSLTFLDNKNAFNDFYFFTFFIK